MSIFIYAILNLFLLLYTVYFVVHLNNSNFNNVSIILIFLWLLLTIINIKFFSSNLKSLKMFFYRKILKNKKLVVAKNVKKHRVYRGMYYFTGTILNPETKKKYDIITEKYCEDFYWLEPKLHFNPKVLFVYVDENDYSKYYVDIKQTKDFAFKLNFKYFEEIFKKYDAFSEKNSILQEIIEKECELDLKYLLKQKIIIEKEGKYFYSLNEVDKVIKLNCEKLRKLKKEYIMQILSIIIISLVIGAIILYILSKFL